MAKEIVFRSRLRRPDRVQFATSGVSMTKQSFKDECDINRIMSSYRRTGLISHTKGEGLAYQDLPDAMDYHAAVSKVVAADQAFARLPSRVRDRFGNRPGDMLRFLEDEANRDEAIEMGLVRPADEPAVLQEAAPVGAAPAGSKT